MSVETLVANCSIFLKTADPTVLKFSEIECEKIKCLTEVHDSYFGIRQGLVSIYQNIDDINSKFNFFDFIIFLCRHFKAKNVLEPEFLDGLVAEINPENLLEMTLAVDAVVELFDLEGFADLMSSYNSGHTERVIEMFKTAVRNNFETEDELFYIALVKLCSVLAPEIITTLNFDQQLSPNLHKIFLEALEHIYERSKPGLSISMVDFVLKSLDRIPMENITIPAINLCNHLPIEVRSTFVTKINSFKESPIHDIRLAALQFFTVLHMTLDGTKMCQTLPGFLDWLLSRSTESTKSCLDEKYEIAKNLCMHIPSLVLDSRIILEIKKFIRDGPYYDSSAPEPQVMTENN